MNNLSITPGKNNVGAYINNIDLKNLKQNQVDEIKNILSQLISEENKKKPITDEVLSSLLREKGFIIARRTIAKYREQLDIPVARLRKEL